MFGKKKQNNVSVEEFGSSMNTIAMDISRVKSEINDIKRAYVCMSKDLDETNANIRITKNAIAGLIEIIRNNSTKKQLEAKNELSDGQVLTTDELYEVVLALIG